MARSMDEVARFRTNKELYDANYDHIFNKKDTKRTEETSNDQSIPESLDDSSHTTDETVVQVQGTVDKCIGCGSVLTEDEMLYLINTCCKCEQEVQDVDF